ncbi:unnamed protein product [Arabis nemorensis]|uniref:Uncharacterized protein n=1 Tax=Arabis nemorensis TaxID=586526 RepID=A0A565CDU1_9BRAS|nr:unnamed protein product [Arabis nemorensis]
MGGGRVMATASKVAGIGVSKGGFRGGFGFAAAAPSPASEQFMVTNTAVSKPVTASISSVAHHSVNCSVRLRFLIFIFLSLFYFLGYLQCEVEILRSSRGSARTITWPMRMNIALDIARNIVSTVNLDCKLDLKAIAFQARNVEYNPNVCCSVYPCHLFVMCFVVVFTGVKRFESGDTTKLKINRILNSSGQTGRSWGNRIGVIGLIYAGIESGVVAWNDRDDVWTSVVTGLGTRTVFRAARGVRSAAVAGALGDLAAGAVVADVAAKCCESNWKTLFIVEIFDRKLL